MKNGRFKYSLGTLTEERYKGGTDWESFVAQYFPE